MLIADTKGGHQDEKTLGYDCALLVVQRWVHEYTSRKRLFSTEHGYLIIGWCALEVRDAIVMVPGLKTPFVMRKVTSSDASETYKLMGPCDIPVVDGKRLWENTPGVPMSFNII